MPSIWETKGQQKTTVCQASGKQKGNKRQQLMFACLHLLIFEKFKILHKVY